MNESVEDVVRSQAHWRRQKAAEFPNDPGNLQSAEALDSLADYVAAEADSTVGLLQELMVDGLLGGQKTSRELSRYGYGFNVVGEFQHEELLEELHGLVMEDAYDAVREGAQDDPTEGGLNPIEVEAAKLGVELGPRWFTTYRVRKTESEVDEIVETAIAAHQEGHRGK